MMSTSLALEARSIGRRSPVDGKWLLRNVSLEVPLGSITAVVGATGSGKTLLLRSLARLDALDAGEVLWAGQPIRGPAVPGFRRQVLYLHQRPALVEGTVEANLRLPFELGVHHGREFRTDTVHALLERVDLGPEFLAKPSRDLSGGESQIAALIRALQLEPTLLLLDEPTAALDQESTQSIEALVRGWFDVSPGSRGLVWVSHDQEQVQRVAQRTVHLRHGTVDRIEETAHPSNQETPGGMP